MLPAHIQKQIKNWNEQNYDPRCSGYDTWLKPATYGYELAGGEIAEKDKEIDLLNSRDVAWSQKKEQLEDEIQRLKGLLKQEWTKSHKPNSVDTSHSIIDNWLQFCKDNKMQ